MRRDFFPQIQSSPGSPAGCRPKCGTQTAQRAKNQTFEQAQQPTRQENRDASHRARISRPAGRLPQEKVKAQDTPAGRKRRQKRDKSSRAKGEHVERKHQPLRRPEQNPIHAQNIIKRAEQHTRGGSQQKAAELRLQRKVQLRHLNRRERKPPSLRPSV